MSQPPQPSLRRELLIKLGLLVAAALSLAIGTALLVEVLDPSYAAVALVLLVAADVAIVFVYGRDLLNRLVLKPMATLNQAADELASGRLEQRAPPAETRDFTELAERFNRMTERLLDAQGELVRTEKLATLGRLAAGVAHEIGNPLSAIGTYLEVLGKRGVDPQILAELSRESGRIDRIVRGLLDYARPRADERLGSVDVNQVVRSVRDLLEHQGVLKGLTLTLRCAEGVPLVAGKAHPLEQVVVNLLLNAVAAAPGGRVIVGTLPTQYRAPEAPIRRSSDPPAVPGQRPPPRSSSRRPWRPDLPTGTPGTLLWVADSGPGVAPGDRERVFDPFFTTKPPGEGTGLGLAIVQRTVHELGGVIWVEDAREGGAAFKVFLPAAAEVRA